MGLMSDSPTDPLVPVQFGKWQPILQRPALQGIDRLLQELPDDPQTRQEQQCLPKPAKQYHEGCGLQLLVEMPAIVVSIWLAISHSFCAIHRAKRLIGTEGFGSCSALARISMLCMLDPP